VALALQRRFVADASHELRTPLTLLSTRAQLLRRRVGDADGRIATDADGLVRDTRHLNRILEDLLIAADPRTPSDEPVDLAAVVEESVTAAEPAAGAAGIRLHRAAPDLGVPVTGSAAALRRAVTALLDNAIQHAESRVDITITTAARTVELTVGDDGPGIAADVLPRLFNRFASFRPASGGRRSYGLGLALVSEIAQRHNGSVSAGNSSAGGAVLRLSLPRAHS
jgi:signal transduction histidine kinase